MAPNPAIAYAQYVPASELLPLRFGAPVRFSDRWQGSLYAIEIDESWEVLNAIIFRGLLRWRSGVKLPFSAAMEWSSGQIVFNCTSTQAFAREVPPVAVLAKSLSARTNVAPAGLSLAGVLVRGNDRVVESLLVSRRTTPGRLFQVATDGAGFDGKTLVAAHQAETLSPYRSDAELRELVRRALALDSGVTPEDRQHLSVDVSEAAATLDGNVRTPQARERVERLVMEIDGLSGMRNDVIDDFTLERDVTLALEAGGVLRDSQVHPRGTFGQVTLFGFCPSPQTAAEAVRIASRVRGVHGVTNRLEAAAAATA